MSLSNVTKEIEAKLPSRIGSLPWNRSVAAGTLLTSAVLLITGHRKAAVAVAAAGTAVALLEDPKSLQKFWDDVPDYVKAGQRLLGRVEGLVEQIAEQGDTLRDVFRRV